MLLEAYVTDISAEKTIMVQGTCCWKPMLRDMWQVKLSLSKAHVAGSLCYCYV